MVAAQLPSSIKALEAKRAGRVQSKLMEVNGAMLAVNNSIGCYSPGVLGFYFRWSRILFSTQRREAIYICSACSLCEFYAVVLLA